jgi:hypothetical protein
MIMMVILKNDEGDDEGDHNHDTLIPWTVPFARGVPKDGDIYHRHMNLHIDYE